MSAPKKLKISLEQKLKLFDIVNSSTSNNLLSESCMDKDRIQGWSSTSIFQAKIRDARFLKMERMLYIWIADLHQKRIPYTQIETEAKAISLYKDLNFLENKNVSPWFPFTFRTGWFERFQQQIGPQSLRLFGFSESANKLAAARYPEELSAIIEKGKYKDEQIFNVDDISFFWKKLSLHTHLGSEQYPPYDSEYFNTSNEQLTILLGGNAAGDFKLKPMIVCPSQNAQDFDDFSNCDLSVIANKLAWLTNTIFEEWFTNNFCPATERYCQEKGLDHNILLILDNAPGHKLNTIHKNVQVIYIPLKTTPLLQPMDQGIFTIFKANYIRNILQEAIKETSSDNGPPLEEYWKNYSIKNALVNINNAWDELTTSEMRGVWKHILPERGGYDDNFNVDSNLNEVTKIIVELGHKLGFDERFNSKNVLDCINWNNIELDNKALIDLMSNNEEKCTNELTIAELEIIIALADKFTRYVTIDPDKERSSLVANAFNDSIRCYKDLYEKKKNEKSNLN